LAFAQLVAPDHDGFKGQRAFAQPANHRVAARLDAFGDGDLALARQQLDRAHLAQIHAHRVIGAVLRRGGVLTGDDVRFGFLGDGGGLLLVLLVVRLGAGRFRVRVLFGIHDRDPHLGELGEDVLDLLGAEFLARKDLVQLVMGDVTALLGGLDHRFDGLIGQVEQRPVLVFRGRFGVFSGGFSHAVIMLRKDATLARHSRRQRCALAITMFKL
jgi:hypothetical protein